MLKSQPKILVVGDLMLDHYIWGSCDRISPEAPVGVIKVLKETRRVGGAGNVAQNLVKLGAKVGIISVLGRDFIGNQTLNILEENSINTQNIFFEPNRQSSQKSRIMATHQQVLRVDREDTVDILDEERLIDTFKKCLKDYDLVLLSDYNKGVLTKKISLELIKECNKLNKHILVDPKGKDYSKYFGATLLTPNKKEASQACDITIKDQNSLKSALANLKQIANLKYSLITLSEDGIALLDDEVKLFPAIEQEVFDVTGAGDTVLATLGYMLAQNSSIEEAIKVANLAAAVVVKKIGSAYATWSEIDEISSYKSGFERKIKTLSQLQNQNLKDKKVVFTNGCFDIIHLGHIKYLQKAKSFGDILIVGLNSDNSIKNLKGQNRPINCEFDRLRLLAALEFVDFVVLFDEQTPINLIKAIKPDILVKGADYDGKNVVGSDIIKDVRLVEFEDGKSTTNIIDKIKG